MSHLGGGQGEVVVQGVVHGRERVAHGVVGSLGMALDSVAPAVEANTVSQRPRLAAVRPEPFPRGLFTQHFS